jgi:flavin reductase (DIM6/NTAB) family NADH-FMN oxidoreductase RutF
VTVAHVPASLRPLIIGIEIPSNVRAAFSGVKDASLVISDAKTDRELATIRLRASSVVPTRSSELQLFAVEGCANHCIPRPERWWRYALGWRHAASAARRGDRLQMTERDLRALNAYYVAPRPVYAVGVRHEGRTNIFPMDLVGALPSGAFCLALRSTSPSVELIERSGRVAMSGAPSHMLTDIYALGRHHREPTVDLSCLPFKVSLSERFELPLIAEASIVRELTVRSGTRVGSHMFFDCDIERELGEPQHMIAHTSAMHVEWVRRGGESVDVVSANRPSR